MGRGRKGISMAMTMKSLCQAATVEETVMVVVLAGEVRRLGGRTTAGWGGTDEVSAVLVTP